MQTPSVGIDVGTTNSSIALATGGEATVVGNGIGGLTTPSVVAFDGDRAIVGNRAIDQAIDQPIRTISSCKRFVGTDKTIHFGSGEEFTPEEVIALILTALKRDAQREIGHQIERSVITVPAHFTAGQRRAMKHACKIAGLAVDRVIDESTAACLAYGLQTGTDETVLVYDLGGGSFGTSLIDITDGVFEVVATNGDPRLGGDEWDAAIVNWLDVQIEHAYGIHLEGNPSANERLFESARTAKHDLSDHTSTMLTIPALEHEGNTYRIKQRLHRSQVERITRDFIAGTISICKDLLEAAGPGYHTGMIDEILLLGRATRMPAVRERVTEYFGQSPERIDADAAVAIGATALAAIIHDDPLPVSPPADSLTTEDVVVLDATPHSLRVEPTEPETAEHHIHNNAPIPARMTNVFTTTYDRQKYMMVPVYCDSSSSVTTDTAGADDGERESGENRTELLDEFRIGPIPPRQAGVPTISAEFELDRNGMIQTRVEDLDYEGRSAIEIESVFSFTQAELDTMKQGLPQIR